MNQSLWILRSKGQTQGENKYLITYLSHILSTANAVIIVDGDFQGGIGEVRSLHRGVDEGLVPLGLKCSGHRLCPSFALFTATNKRSG